VRALIEENREKLLEAWQGHISAKRERTGERCACVGGHIDGRFDGRSNYLSTLGLVSEIIGWDTETAVELEGMRRWLRYPLARSRRGSQHGGLTAWRTGTVRFGSSPNKPLQATAENPPRLSEALVRASHLSKPGTLLFAEALQWKVLLGNPTP
jgi:hypothetical protein